MILIDKQTNGWSHMVGDSIEELHEFAQSIGIKRCWYSNKRKNKSHHEPHYDVAGKNMFQRAIESGAILASKRDLLTFLQFTYPK